MICYYRQYERGKMLSDGGVEWFETNQCIQCGAENAYHRFEGLVLVEEFMKSSHEPVGKSLTICLSSI